MYVLYEAVMKIGLVPKRCPSLTYAERIPPRVVHPVSPRKEPQPGLLVGFDFQGNLDNSWADFDPDRASPTGFSAQEVET